MKIIKKSSLSNEEEKNKYFLEIKVLNKLDHPHILKMYEFY